MTNKNIILFEKILKLNLLNSEEIKSFITTYTGISPSDISIDNYGNIIKLGNNTKKLIAFDYSPVGFSVEKKIENRIYLDLIGCNDKINLNGKKTLIGTIKKEKDKFYINNSNLNMQFFHKNFSITEGCICEGNSLYGIQLKAYISLYMLVKLIITASDTVKLYSFALINKGFSADYGYIEIIKRLMPEKIVYASFCNDNNLIKIDKGPAIVIKDGNGVTREDVYLKINEIADMSNLSYQFYVGKTDKTYENISISKSNLDYAGIYVPVKEMSNGENKIIFDDVEKTLNLLLKYIDDM